MNVVFSPDAWKDFTHWALEAPEIQKKIIELLNNIQRTPFQGIGKPEALKGNLKGCWSRRITKEHRLVYRIKGKKEDDTQRVEVISCRYHY
jgi:toxin YoeB